MSTTSQQEKYKPDDAELYAKYLWEEYKYRHDLCWRVAFQLTAAIVILMVIPYLHRDIVQVLQYAILLVPFLAIALVGFGIFLMQNELNRFQGIKDEYRGIQVCTFKISVPEDKVITFRNLMLFYFTTLFIVSVINFCFLAFIWVPANKSPQPNQGAITHPANVTPDK